MANPNWKKGMRSPNPSGRPRNLAEKRKRVTNALLRDAETIARVVSAAATEGDLTAAGMVLDRAVPALKREGALVRFELDASLPTSKQLAQVTQAIADGALTVDEAKHLVAMICMQAEARKLEGSGEQAERLVAAFRELATHMPV